MNNIIRTIIFAGFIMLCGLIYGAHNENTQDFSAVGPEGIPMLMEFAKYTDPKDIDARTKAIARLGELKAEKAVPVIIEALGAGRETMVEVKDPFWRVRMNAATALGDIGTDDAVIPLKDAARLDRNAVVQRAAIQSLGRMGEKARTKLVLENLFKLLEQTQDSSLANDICWALGKIGDKKAMPYLMKVDQREYLQVVKQTAKTAISELKWDKESAIPD